MSTITRKPQSSHWYHRDGTACHEVIGKSTGLPRPTTVADARKMDLIPSVTNILGMKAKPALITWLQDNAIRAALATPRRDGEPEEQWHSRIAEESDRIGSEAAEWGTLIHEQCEQFATQGACLGTGEILQYVEPFVDWFCANVTEVEATEKSIVAPLGYAGRLDLLACYQGRRAVIDYKSQKLKGKAKGSFYKEWPMQLAAYGDPMRIDGELPLLVSVIIPSDIPGPVQVKVWDREEEALEAFRACFRLWCYEKDYTPERREA